MVDTREAPRRRRRSRLSPLTVIGELLLLGGVGVLGYIVWQPWHTGLTVTAKQVELSASDSARWAQADTTPWDGTIPVTAQPEAAEVFAVLHVPAFGTTYANRVAETTDWWSVLNLDEKGIGRYEMTQLPGEVGNMALAGHRSGPLINSFREVMNLRVGDPLFVETADGWYTYRFRNLEYVQPSDIDVIDPIPWSTDVAPTDRIITLTSCNPLLSTAERIIAYGVLESWQPRSAGAPAELAASLAQEG
jgi:sortase A